jgi:uncharacterized membrane protein
MGSVIKRGGVPARWRRIALPVSIVLNLFFVALIGGYVLHHRGERLAGETPLMRALARAEASLPPRDATAFGAVIRRDAPQYSDALKRLDVARQELRREITAEQFDEAGVRQALAGWQTAWNSFFEKFSNTLVDALAQVSPGGRRRLIAERRSEVEGRSSAP